MRIIVFPGRQGASQPAKVPAPLAEVVALFLVDLRLAGRRPLTCKRHALELRRYGHWLEEQTTTWRDVSEDDTLDYARTRVHLRESTRAQTICSLKVFYEWCVERGYLTLSPAAHLKGPSRPQPTPKALTRAQIGALIAYLKRGKGLRARRDEVLFLTALYTGLRAQELAGLCWGDIDLDARIILIGLSKMNHGRAVSVHPDVVALLRTWRKLQNLGDNAPVFGSTCRSPYGQAITAERVGKIMRSIKADTGIDFHTHRLRHSFATWTLRESKDLFAVSKALGHKQLKQTEIYIAAAVDIEHIDEAVCKLPGLNAW